MPATTSPARIVTPFPGTEVMVTRLTGSGPRQIGHVYSGTVVDDGRSICATYSGRRGGHDLWKIDGVEGPRRDGGVIAGDFAFLVATYGVPHPDMGGHTPGDCAYCSE